MKTGTIRIKVNHDRRDIDYQIVERDGKQFLVIPEIDVTPAFIIADKGVVTTKREFMRSLSMNFWHRWTEESSE